MKIIRPYVVQEADLTTNATNADADWNSATSYTIGQRVSYNKRIYESIQNGSNKNPETQPAFWFDVGPNNIWSMFDDRTGTQTTKASPLDVSVLVSGYADTLGLVNIRGTQLDVYVNDSGGQVFHETISLLNEDTIVDYYEYFFEPFTMLTDAVVNLPVDVLDPTVRVVLTGTGDVAIGQMTLGQSYYIGKVHWGAQLSGTDYSRVEEDAFGNTFISERAYNRTGRFTVTIDSSRLDAVYNIVTGYRATPVFVIGVERYGASFYYGLLRDAVIEIAYPKYAILSLEVRGI